MYDFKKIVVGLELGSEGKAVSAGSRKAALQALWVAKANGGSIHFVHSTYNDEYHATVVAGESVVHEGLSAEGRAALDAVVEETRAAGVEATLDIYPDRVWLEISRAALRDQADLVIVGKRNESSEDGRKLGNVAVKLLRKCPTPVWVVKPEHDLVHRLVLAATDLEPVGDQAVRFAAYVAKRHECELHIVHAWQMPFALQMESANMDDEELAQEVEEVRQACIDHIKQSLGKYEGPHEPHIHTSKGSPAQMIREAVNHLDPDLLVMGTISRAGLAGVLIGSTAERLLDRVDCSILAVKPEDFVSPVTL
jgi:universal stress protein E